jgi:hypothetical protein
VNSGASLPVNPMPRSVASGTQPSNLQRFAIIVMVSVWRTFDSAFRALVGAFDNTSLNSVVDAVVGEPLRFVFVAPFANGGFSGFGFPSVFFSVFGSVFFRVLFSPFSSLTIYMITVFLSVRPLPLCPARLTVRPVSRYCGTVFFHFREWPVLFTSGTILGIHSDSPLIRVARGWDAATPHSRILSQGVFSG